MTRERKGALALVVDAAAILLSLYHVVFISGLASKLGFQLFLLPYRAASLGLVLLLIFLTCPATRRSGERPAWYDVAFALMGVLPCLYLLMNATRLIENDLQFNYTPALVTFLVLAVALLEAVRRTTGLSIVIVAAVFFSYPLLQGHIPGLLGGPSFEVAQMASYLLVNQDLGLLGVAYGAASSIIVVYILFSQFLMTSGASDFFINLALSLMGSVRGGPAKVAIIASGFFGTLSGSVSANVAATGSITIPLMKKTGYTAHFAGAVEAVASNGGQIVPPVMGLVVFVMADVTGIPYWKIVLASIFPAVLYYLGLFVQVDMEAAKTGLTGVPRESLPSFKATMREGWFHLIPLIGLVVILVVLKRSPEMSGLYAIAILLAVNLFSRQKRLGPGELVQALASAARAFVMPAAVCALMGVIIGSVMQTGLGVKLSSFLIEISGSSVLLLLLLTALVCYILGGEMGSIPLYIMMVVLTAPALLKSGVDTLSSHLFVLWFGLTSFITPPVCIAVYVACGISGANVWRTGLDAMRLGMATYFVPFLFVYRPGLLLKGAPLEIAIDFVWSAIGLAAIALAAAGYLLQPLKPAERGALIFGGALLIFPGVVTDVAGLTVLSAAVLVHVYRRGRRREARAAALSLGGPEG